MKTRAELSERVRAVVAVERARAAEAASQAGHEIRAMLNPVLGLAATVLVIRLNAQPPMSAIAQSADNLPYLFGDILDLSKLETALLATEQRAFSSENLVDQTASMAGVWADQQAIGLWMADFNGDSRADMPWQNHGGQAAAWLMNAPSLIFERDAGSDPAASHIQAASDFSSHEVVDTVWQDADAMPAAWLMEGFDLASDGDAGFNPAAGWQDIPQYYDLA